MAKKKKKGSPRDYKGRVKKTTISKAAESVAIAEIVPPLGEKSAFAMGGITEMVREQYAQVIKEYGFKGKTEMKIAKASVIIAARKHYGNKAAISRMTQVPRSTINGWIKGDSAKEADLGFANAWNDVRISMVEHGISKLMENVEKGDQRAVEYLLNNAMSNRWLGVTDTAASDNNAQADKLFALYEKHLVDNTDPNDKGDEC